MTEDQVLVSRVRSGDMQAFKQLVRQHERLVMHMIGRLIRDDQDREELCQDVFLRVYEKLGEFNFQSKLSTWVATVAYRSAINHLRKKRISTSSFESEDYFLTEAIAQGTPEELLTEADQEEMVLKLIEYLPVQYKIVLTLYHLEGLSYEEIGATMDMPAGTVKSYLFRARHLLKEKLTYYLAKERV